MMPSHSRPPTTAWLIHLSLSLPLCGSGRYGFPGKTNRSWGWLGGASGDEELPWEDEDEEEEEWEEKEEEDGAEGNGGEPAAPRGEVVALKSREDLRALVEEGGTMVFVSSRSCRACKYLTG